MFFKIPEEIISDENLTSKEIIIYSVIHTWTEMNGDAYLSHSILMKKYKCSHPARILKSLLDKKYIIRTKKSQYKTTNINDDKMSDDKMSDDKMSDTTMTKCISNDDKMSSQTMTKCLTERKNIKKNIKKEKHILNYSENPVPTERKPKSKTIDIMKELGI